MSNLTITTEFVGTASVVRIAGGVTLAAADHLQAIVTRIIASRPEVVVVDLAGLTDISSLFAGQLVALQQGLKHHAGRAFIAAPIPAVRVALDRMRITQLLPIHDSVEQALEAGRAPQ